MDYEEYTQTYLDYESIGAIVDPYSLALKSRAKRLVVVDRHKLRNGDKPAKNVRHRWQLVSCDNNSRYCRTFRTKKEAFARMMQFTEKRMKREGSL